jgi:hypothetical protein
MKFCDLCVVVGAKILRLNSEVLLISYSEFERILSWPFYVILSSEMRS